MGAAADASNPDSDAAGHRRARPVRGARYLTTGMYRPTYSMCLMRSLGSTFCPVCAAATSSACMAAASARRRPAST
ncbi:MAG: hypothetical protein IPG63_17550 [Xanthomonadales bacterium]|nr:hypothetical protein [Xanthomonadales bacterium]